MSARRVIVGLKLTLKVLSRRKIILIALIFIPAAFLSVVQFTASEKLIVFQLASLDSPVYIELEQRGISLIFFSVTSTGFLVSFLALNLIQVDYEVNRRLVLSGYHPLELMLAKVLALMLIIIFIAVYLAVLANGFYPIKHMIAFIVGLVLTGFVYGCYGLTMGSFVRGELEGVFLIVLLANIDVGWLQNPVFYAEAHNKEIIRYLPGYFPSQSATIAALTDHSAFNAQIKSLLYGSGFLLSALSIFYLQIRRKH